MNKLKPFTVTRGYLHNKICLLKRGHLGCDFGKDEDTIELKGTPVEEEGHGYDHGHNAKCNVCFKQYCQCPERQSDGSWQPEPQGNPICPIQDCKNTRKKKGIKGTFRSKCNKHRKFVYPKPQEEECKHLAESYLKEICDKVTNKWLRLYECGDCKIKFVRSYLSKDKPQPIKRWAIEETRHVGSTYDLAMLVDKKLNELIEAINEIRK